MLSTVPDLPPSPEQELKILYQFCGAGDMRGGVQDAVNNTAGYMRTQGHGVAAFIGSAEDPEQTHKIFDKFSPNSLVVLGDKNNTTFANDSQNQIGSITWPSKFEELLAANKPDVIHIQSPWKPYIGGFLLGAARRMGDIATVGTWHIHSEETKMKWLMRASRAANWRVIQDLDAMIVVSDAAEDYMRQSYGYKGPVHNIPNSVDVDFFANARPFEPDEPFEGYDPVNNKIISFVGRPDPRKGLGELIEAVSILRRKEPNIQLIIGSHGPNLDDYKQLARVFGVNKITHFLGDIDDHEKARLFASSDIAALPAKHGESQGIVLLEAMAAGAKVVMGGDNPGYRGVLGEVDPDEMVLTDPTNAVEFAEKMRTLLDGTCLSAHIHEQQQFLVQKYDIAAVGQRVLEVYRSVL